LKHNLSWRGTQLQQLKVGRANKEGFLVRGEFEGSGRHSLDVTEIAEERLPLHLRGRENLKRELGPLGERCVSCPKRQSEKVLKKKKEKDEVVLYGERNAIDRKETQS